MNQSSDARRMMRIIRNDDANAITLMHAAGMLDPNITIGNEAALIRALENNANKVAYALITAGASTILNGFRSIINNTNPIHHIIKANDPQLFTHAWEHTTKSTNPDIQRDLLQDRIAAFDRKNAEAVFARHSSVRVDASVVLGLMVNNLRYVRETCGGDDVAADIAWVVGVLERHDPEFVTRNKLSEGLIAAAGAPLRVEVVRALVNLGADVNFVDSLGRTAFSNALQNHAMEAARYLLPLVDGVNHVVRVLDDRVTLLDVAVMRNASLIRGIVERGGRSLDGTIQSSRLRAVRQNHGDAVRVLMEVPSSAADDTEVLRAALDAGSAWSLQEILKAKPHLLHSFVTPEGLTPIAYATANVHPKTAIITNLIEAGANLGVTQPDGTVPFFNLVNHCLRTAEVRKMAHGEHHLRNLRFTLQATKNASDVVRLAGAFGNTALHKAVRVKYEELVVLLLKYGADPDATNDEGVSPRALARQLRQRRITQRFKTADAIGENMLTNESLEHAA